MDNIQAKDALYIIEHFNNKDEIIAVIKNSHISSEEFEVLVNAFNTIRHYTYKDGTFNRGFSCFLRIDYRTTFYCQGTTGCNHPKTGDLPDEICRVCKKIGKIISLEEEKHG